MTGSGTSTTTAPPTTPRRRRHPAMSATATLTNCYVPLPVDPSSTSTGSSVPFDPWRRPTHDDDNHHNDDNYHDDDNAPPATRGPKTLRRLRFRRSLLSQSSGSALVEWGHTKVLCSVRGPRPFHCSGLSHGGNGNHGGGNNNNAATLLCQVRYLSQIGIRPESLARHSFVGDTSQHAPSTSSKLPKDVLSTSQDAAPYLSSSSSSSAAWTDETHLSRLLHDALSPAVILDGLGGKCAVDVYVHVLQSDGGAFGAAVAAATLALVDAGVGMKDLVCAGCAAVRTSEEGEAELTNEERAAKRTEWVLADPNEEELLRAEGVVTVAMMPNWREVTVWEQCGRMSVGASREAVEVARDGCATVAKFLRNSLLEGP